MTKRKGMNNTEYVRRRNAVIRSARMLEGSGYEVLRVWSGEDGVDLVGGTLKGLGVLVRVSIKKPIGSEVENLKRIAKRFGCDHLWHYWERGSSCPKVIQ